jgi:hypothetical protein
MIRPNLWNKHLTFEEWRIQYPNLNEKDAFYHYLNELRLFENYQHELLNQQIQVQNQSIAESLYSLADNISNIFSVALDSGGAGFEPIMPRGAEATSRSELITDEGDLLVTDVGEFLITP